MDRDFWHEKWKQKELGFHKREPNPLLLHHFGKLGLEPGSRVLLPLCGKTRDISWLLANGYSVAGSELVPTAIEQLFEELEVTPKVTEVGSLSLYSAKDIDIYVGDIFDLRADTLGHVDAIYDRAALVALPEALRARYADHLMAICHKAPQLLITFDYAQRLMAGPPFSVDEAEVERHYGRHYDVRLASNTTVEGGLKGLYPADELVWVLADRSGS
ncbi:thiopurine S-methyltransferase [Allohahella marinimesophila]|uniref:Thiopurine S-methyltransferase n=1 Tax=Allohahella marinimesophila TaxID=1054972 RepID=A0ABP7NSB8_9GAMM